MHDRVNAFMDNIKGDIYYTTFHWPQAGRAHTFFPLKSMQKTRRFGHLTQCVVHPPAIVKSPEAAF